MNEELKPCPFCGGEADMVYGVPAYDGSYAFCIECGLRTESYKTKSGSTWDVDSAITAWNRRQPDAALVEALERIERLEAERRCIVSHATMGHTTGDGMSLNDISVEISRQRNKLYQAGKDATLTARAGQ